MSYVEAPVKDSAGSASIVLAKAGVKTIKVGRRSMSSCTIAELNATRPTSFSLTRTLGGRSHHHLGGPPHVGPPTLDHGDTVLIKEETVNTGQRVDLPNGTEARR